MMCKMLKVINTRAGDIILDGVGKGEEDIIRNNIIKGKKAFNLSRANNFSNYTKS